MRRTVLLVVLVALPAGADPALSVVLSPPPGPIVGARAEVGISVTPAVGLTLHGLAPLFVDLEAPDALGLERQRLERADALRFDAPAAAFKVGVRPTAAGTHVLAVRVRGWVCRGARCRAVETRRSARVTVSAPP